MKDTSKKYIYMCRKAFEIHETWKPKEGDLVWHNADFRKESGDSRQFCQSLHILINGDKAEGRRPEMLHCPILGIFNLEDLKIPRSKYYTITWLPMQDQLQGMLKHPKHPLYSDTGLLKLLNIFINEFLSKNINLESLRSMSMEHLWLVFVMHQKYKKTWTGKDWVVYKQST